MSRSRLGQSSASASPLLLVVPLTRQLPLICFAAAARAGPAQVATHDPDPADQGNGEHWVRRPNRDFSINWDVNPRSSACVRPAAGRATPKVAEGATADATNAFNASAPAVVERSPVEVGGSEDGPESEIPEPARVPLLEPTSTTACSGSEPPKPGAKTRCSSALPPAASAARPGPARPDWRAPD